MMFNRKICKSPTKPAPDDALRERALAAFDKLTEEQIKELVQDALNRLGPANEVFKR